MKTEICTSNIKRQKRQLVIENGGKKTIKEIKQINKEIDKTYYDKTKARIEAETAQATIFDYIED